MKAIMAVSADGFVARGPDDNMRWLGPYDKAVFKLLTYVGPDPTMIRSRRTELAMPKVLLGRRIVTVSRSTGMDLKQAAKKYPHAWIVGGQELMRVAFVERLVSELYVCWSTRMCFDGIPSTLEEVAKDSGLHLNVEIMVGDTRVKQFTK